MNLGRHNSTHKSAIDDSPLTLLPSPEPKLDSSRKKKQTNTKQKQKNKQDGPTMLPKLLGSL